MATRRQVYGPQRGGIFRADGMRLRLPGATSGISDDSWRNAFATCGWRSGRDMSVIVTFGDWLIVADVTQQQHHRLSTRAGGFLPGVPYRNPFRSTSPVAWVVPACENPKSRDKTLAT
jgi:hypothetical protein